MKEQLKKEKNKKQRKRFVTNIMIYILLIVVAVILVVPFIWTFTTSVKSMSDIVNNPGLLPPAGFSNWKFSNYSEAIETMNYWKSVENTLIITIPKLFGDILVSAFVAYGFSRFEFKGKTVIFMVLLATLMIPFEVTMIPLYIVYQKIGWIDTFYPLIVPSLFGASQFIFFLSMYFLSIPKELVLAAKVDGLSDFQIFRKIYLPISVPALVVVGIWSFQGSWADLLGPLIWLQSADKFTLQLSLASIANTTTYQVDQGVIMAGTMLTMLPVFIVFLIFQKYILDSKKLDGIKG